MRAKENHMVMEDKWEPISMGPTTTGSMLETCTGKAVRRGASGKRAGPVGAPFAQRGTSETSLTQTGRSWRAFRTLICWNWSPL